MAPNRFRPWRAALALIGFVVAASLFGLGIPISLAGPEIIVRVWTASLVGSLVFAFGCAAVAAGGFYLARRYSAIASILLVFVGLWFVYAASWSLTGPAMGEDGAETDFGGDSWRFVFQWGWLGLVLCCFLPAAAAWWMRLREITEPGFVRSTRRPWTRT